MIKKIQINDKNGNVLHPETNTEVVKYKNKNLTSEIDNIKTEVNNKANSSHTHTKSQISDMPTKLSQFANDKNFITINDIDDTPHENRNILDTITQALIDKWNSAYSHISDTVKHITSAERNLWNTVSNKAEKNHTHDDRYYTENEIDNKLGGKVPTSSNSSITVQADSDSSSTSEYISLRAGGNELKIISSAGGSSPAKTNNVFYNGNALYHTGHKPSKGDVGLGNVDNTSDANKPISTATQNALNGKLDKSGGTLTGNVLFSNDNKLSWSRNTDFAEIRFQNTGDNDSNSYMEFKTGDNGNEYFKFNQVNGSTTTELMTIKSDHLRFKGNAVYHVGNKPTKADIGLSNVDNTSDLNKPISTATQNALNGKANTSHTHTKSQITDMPTKLSQFTNDAGYITQAQIDTSQNHTHGNKSVLDGITSANVTNWNNAYSHVSDKRSHIEGKQFDKDYNVNFRGQIYGTSGDGPFVKAIRTDVQGVANAPQFGSGVGFGVGDTHGYIYTSYNNPVAYIGGGNANKLNWTKQLAFIDSNVASSTRATQDSDGKQINTTYVKKDILDNVIKTHTHTKSQITDMPTTMKNPNALTVQFNGTTNKTYDGGSAQTVNITPSAIGAATNNHTHNYAGSSSAGGSANSAVKLATARTIALTGNVTGSANFDGSGNITINTSGISAIPTSTVSALFN